MNTAPDAEDLLALLSEIRGWCQDPVIFSGRSETVSGWSVAQHCEHILKADRLNLRAIEVLLGGGGEEIGESGPTHPVFDQGVIPRGVAKAPDYVMPADEPELESVSLLADRVLSGWTETLPRCQSDSENPIRTGRGIAHHAMGILDIPDWIRFANLHTRHHVDIAHEILAQR